jgi:formyltetrahydrofolate synthetase
MSNNYSRIFHVVLDINDQFLSKIRVGLSGNLRGHERDCEFHVAGTSELMAVLALTSGHLFTIAVLLFNCLNFCYSIGYEDLKTRLANIVVASNLRRTPVTADDLVTFTPNNIQLLNTS